MPDLEEAIMNSVNNGRSSSSSSSSNSNNGSEEGSSSSGSNGASQPSSPSHQPHRNRAAELAAMEQSIEGGLPRPQPMSAGLAGKAAQGFGNEAYKSTDILQHAGQQPWQEPQQAFHSAVTLWLSSCAGSCIFGPLRIASLLQPCNVL